VPCCGVVRGCTIVASRTTASGVASVQAATYGWATLITEAPERTQTYFWWKLLAYETRSCGRGEHYRGAVCRICPHIVIILIGRFRKGPSEVVQSGQAFEESTVDEVVTCGKVVTNLSVVEIGTLVARYQ
jgi:hypothetical protein